MDEQKVLPKMIVDGNVISGICPNCYEKGIKNYTQYNICKCGMKFNRGYYVQNINNLNILFNRVLILMNKENKNCINFYLSDFIDSDYTSIRLKTKNQKYTNDTLYGIEEIINHIYKKSRGKK